MAGEPSDLDAAGIVQAARIARPGLGRRQVTWALAAAVFAVVAGPSWLIVLVLGAAVLTSRLRFVASSNRLAAARVDPGVVQLSLPWRSSRVGRVGRVALRVITVLLVLTLGAMAVAMMFPISGVVVDDWTAGPGLTSDNRAGIVWYDDRARAEGASPARRDHPPLDAVLADAGIPLLLLGFLLFVQRRHQWTPLQPGDPAELRNRLAALPADDPARPFVAAELVLADPHADDAEAVARLARPHHGDPFLPGWALATAQLHRHDLAAAKETLAKTYGAITDGRRVLLAAALAETWAAAGDRAMADDHRANARKLAGALRRRPVSFSVPCLDAATDDATLLTDELDRTVSKNRA